MATLLRIAGWIIVGVAVYWGGNALIESGAFSGLTSSGDAPDGRQQGSESPAAAGTSAKRPRKECTYGEFITPLMGCEKR